MSLVYLVTGAGGYLGRRMETRLLHSPLVRLVVCCDVAFGPGAPASERVQHLSLDVSDARAVAAAVSAARPDVIIHIASYGMSGSSQLRVRGLVFPPNGSCCVFFGAICCCGLG